MPNDRMSFAVKCYPIKQTVKAPAHVPQNSHLGYAWHAPKHIGRASTAKVIGWACVVVGGTAGAAGATAGIGYGIDRWVIGPIAGAPHQPAHGPGGGAGQMPGYGSQIGGWQGVGWQPGPGVGKDTSSQGTDGTLCPPDAPPTHGQPKPVPEPAYIGLAALMGGCVILSTMRRVRRR